MKIFSVDPNTLSDENLEKAIHYLQTIRLNHLKEPSPSPESESEVEEPSSSEERDVGCTIKIRKLFDTLFSFIVTSDDEDEEDESEMESEDSVKQVEVETQTQPDPQQEPQPDPQQETKEENSFEILDSEECTVKSGETSSLP